MCVCIETIEHGCECIMGVCVRIHLCAFGVCGEFLGGGASSELKKVGLKGSPQDTVDSPQQY